MKLSLTIPTYNERENIEVLIERVQREFEKNNIDGEIIVVDDNSPDGTGKILEKMKSRYKNLKVIHRPGKLGLSSAILDGWRVAEGDVLGVMDADLSHPPEKIKDLFGAIKNGADIAIGSRYIKGGRIENWKLTRKIVSKGATLLARLYTSVKDPMSGFFMIKKEVINGVDLKPKGFKILLEILVKGKYQSVAEIPMAFVDRAGGKSKLGTKEILYYLQNLIGYLPYKRSLIKEFIKFATVGGIGTLINIIILYLLTEKVGIYYMISAVFSFIVAMSSNFILNKIWTFGENVRYGIGKKYLKFATVSISALIVNLIFLYIFTEVFGIYYIVSQVLAILIALIINFTGNKVWTFSK